MITKLKKEFIKRKDKYSFIDEKDKYYFYKINKKYVIFKRKISNWTFCEIAPHEIDWISFTTKESALIFWKTIKQ